MPNIHAVVLDIEGTITPISFVRDVLFPFARTHLANFLEINQEDPDVAREIATIQQLAPGSDPVGVLMGWMDQDLKIPPLKTLQGMVWQAGYHHGLLRGQIYPDVAPCLRSWHADGIALYIYSSGSVAAQQLLLGHSTDGDLSPLFSGFFDTNVGAKRDEASYRAISAQIGINRGEGLFLSDVTVELDAAAAAGWRTAQIVRPNDGTVASAGHPNFGNFAAARLEHLDFAGA